MKSFKEILIEEKKGLNPVVMTFGRMNPPTTGHEKLVAKVKEIAHEHSAPHHVVLSSTQDKKKNPLTAQQKLTHAKRAFPGTNLSVATKEHPTFLQHAAKLHKAGHNHLIMVAGSDRIPEYKELLSKYNGTHEGALFNFKKIDVKSAGHRDPDAEGTEGMSASKMREHATKGEYHHFKNGLPDHMSDAHKKEVYHDVRKGMGLHENENEGMFKAIFVTGGPGSGKDIVIRESISCGSIAEIDISRAVSIFSDKGTLSESSDDFRKESIRNRRPVIINGSATSNDILTIKEELEELGYATMMIFVNTSDYASKTRNAGLSRMMTEDIRHKKWKTSQTNSLVFKENFSYYIEFDNSLGVSDITEELNFLGSMITSFMEEAIVSESALVWMQEHQRRDNLDAQIYGLFESFDIKSDAIQKRKDTIRQNIEKMRDKKRRDSDIANKSIQKLRQSLKNEEKDDQGTTNRFVEGDSKSIQKRTSSGCSKHKLFDNICPGCQLTSIEFSPKKSSVRDKDASGPKTNLSQIFSTEQAEQAQPTIKAGPEPKETNFSQDKDKKRLKKVGYKSNTPDPYGNIKGTGIGPEYDTRGQGTVYPMSGIGQSISSGYVPKNFGQIIREVRAVKEAMDSPSTEMGVTGGEFGASNKDELQTIGMKVQTAMGPDGKKKRSRFSRDKDIEKQIKDSKDSN